VAIAWLSASSIASLGSGTRVATFTTGAVTAVPTGGAACIMVGANFTAARTVTIADNAAGNVNAGKYTQIDPATGMTNDFAGVTDYSAATFLGLNLTGGPTTWTATYSATDGAFSILLVDVFTGVLTASALGGQDLTAPAQWRAPIVANDVTTTAYTSTAGNTLWASAFNVNSGGATTVGTTLS